MRRILLLLCVLAVLAGGWVLLRPKAAPVAVKPSRSDAIVFIVMDTVRADHTSLCGYSRPTTPNLKKLASKGISGCNVKAPGSWTLPSHASYFTGKQVIEHGAHELPEHAATREGSRVPGSSAPARRLNMGTETLASLLAARGYQTLMVSGNPVVSKATRLSQGFSHIHTARKVHDYAGSKLTNRLKRSLAEEIDPAGGPLFVFINIADAHSSWVAVPDGLDWIPATPAVSFGKQADPNSLWQRYWHGKLADAERTEFLGNLVNAYDYGVRRADRVLGSTLSLLKKQGWCGKGCRIVVASDHGEMLGEHGMINHGWMPWEPNARVPMVAVGVDEKEIPSGMNGLHVFDLVLNGRLPESRQPAEQPFWPHAERMAQSNNHFQTTGAIHWEGDTKTVWEDGVVRRYDLGADPGEEHAQILLEIPPELQALTAAVRAEEGEEKDAEVEEALKAVGYVE